jgi:hypothetical protein
MRNLISRIKDLEKKVKVEDNDLSELCLIVDEDENGNKFYTDKQGIKHEYNANTYEGKKPQIVVMLTNYQSNKPCQT